MTYQLLVAGAGVAGTFHLNVTYRVHREGACGAVGDIGVVLFWYFGSSVRAVYRLGLV